MSIASTSALRHLLVVTIVLAALSSTEAATTVTVQPDGTTANSGDTFVGPGPTGLLVNNNYGGAGAVEVSAAGTAKGEFKSVLRFDTSTAASSFNSAYGANGWAIDSIVLQLTVANPANAIFNANAAGQLLVQWLNSDAWIEGNGTPQAANNIAGALTWNTLQSIVDAGVEGEGTFAYGGDASGTTLSFTLTPTQGLSNDVLAGTQASLLLGSAASGTSALFNSRTGTGHPALIITASALPVPEPGRAFLLMAGVVPLGMRRRRNPAIRHCQS